MTDELIAVFGRLHPAILHLPIGLLVGVIALEILSALRPRLALRPAITALCWITAIVAGVSAFSGWMLAREPGYGGDDLETHRWLGVALAGSALMLALLHGRQGRTAAYRAALAVTMLLLIVTGHFGGTLTHGSGFVTEPLLASLRDETFAEQTMFAQRIQPIFTSSCGSCHSASKRKGGLALDSHEAILAGGKHGVVIIAGKAETSELIRRIKLPLDDEDHMPPEDKRQPSAEEIAALEAWVAGGASLTAPAGTPSVRSADISPASAGEKKMQAATSQQLEALRAALVHVQPVEPDSPLLWIDFAAPASGQLADDGFVAPLLKPVAPFVKDLALAGSSISNATMDVIATMPNLARLDVRKTAIDDAGVASLRRLAQLEELNLVGTKVSDVSIEWLGEMPALKRVYVWSSAMTPEGVRRLRAARAGLLVDAGDNLDSKPLEVEPIVEVGKPAPPAAGAVVAAASSLAPVNSVCPVAGAAVDPKFAVVYEGKVIGFCCQNCAKKFLDDPKAYADKVK